MKNSIRNCNKSSTVNNSPNRMKKSEPIKIINGNKMKQGRIINTEKLSARENLSPKILKEIFNLLDSDKDGYISYNKIYLKSIL